MAGFKNLLLTALLLHTALAFCQATHSDPGAFNFEEPILPLPAIPALDNNKVALGKKLFFDSRLSRSNQINCASCHDFTKGGADPRPRSIGVDGRVGAVNAPSVFNASLNFRQMWSGKAKTLEELLDLIIQSPTVFDTTWEAIVAKISSDGILRQEFLNIYGTTPERKNIIDAIATYQRSLITPSRFDAYLQGNENAITPDEKQGYKLFKRYGCVACHQGSNIGGNMFQRFGVVQAYSSPELNGQQTYTGRHLVTKKESDKNVFKVPSLRNVALTAPYFHDGSAATLEEAVDAMFKYQLGRKAPIGDKTLIIQFLNSLNGSPPSHNQNISKEKQ